MTDIIRHYDLLIEENNDPVTDPPELQNYMELWDGKAFLSALALDKTKSVLEIGVGTGRLAKKTVPLCGKFTGIDLSPKTIDRAGQHLSFSAPHLICADFLTYSFEEKFDVVYSSLTFMHIKAKRNAIRKTFELLNPQGRFVLSIDKNQNKILDCNHRKIRLYPDSKEQTESILAAVGFQISQILETELAYIFVANKEQSCA